MLFGSAVRISIALLASASLANACLWLHGTTIDGHFGRFPGRILGFPEGLRKAMARVPQHEASLFKSHSYKPDDPAAKANDKAVETLLRGDAKKAVEMLNQVEFDYPGVYYTAANLGTAYELSGDDTNALKWILEGIKRNPDSHMRTEWLHVRILETKIKLKTDPQWLASHTITGVDPARLGEVGYYIETAQRRLDADEIADSLFRQLSVRMLFVKPKDPIVAQLLNELALCEAQMGTLENADQYARMAVQYGLPIERLLPKVTEWRKIIEQAKKNPVAPTR